MSSQGSFLHTASLSSSFKTSPSKSGASTPIAQLRPAKPLPIELCEHCVIYFEESLYAQVLHLLISILSSGSSTVQVKPAFVPPPQHLGLIATLAIHPSLTNRAKSTDRVQAGILALKYLRLLHKVVGPAHAIVRDAFVFTGGKDSRRSVGSRRRIAGGESPISRDSEQVHSEYANENGLWTRAEDFWQAVGWAFNCSVKYRNRWEPWRLWLEYMLGVLEDDWEMCSDEQRENSLIVSYLHPQDHGSSNIKRVIRAIFADGTPKSLAEFKEVWPNEAKERKVGKDASAAKKAAKVNIEEDDFGDYLSSSSSDDIEPDPAPPLTGPFLADASSINLSDGSLLLGGPPALTLRLRLLALLTFVSSTFPSTATALPTLYDLYLTSIRPLPLPTFALFLSPPSLAHFSPAAATRLTAHITISLIESAAPVTRGADEDLSQSVLEACYLPWAANTGSVADNAKVSCCVEALVRVFDTVVGLEWGRGLEKCMERGIRAREEKAKSTGRRKGEAGGGGSEADRRWLRGSGERLRNVVRMAKKRHEGVDVMMGE